VSCVIVALRSGVHVGDAIFCKAYNRRAHAAGMRTRESVGMNVSPPNACKVRTNGSTVVAPRAMTRRREASPSPDTGQRARAARPRNRVDFGDNRNLVVAP